MTYRCGNMRSASLAQVVATARATVLTDGMARISAPPSRGVLVWRRDDRWIVQMISMMPMEADRRLKSKVEELLEEHG